MSDHPHPRTTDPPGDLTRTVDPWATVSYAGLSPPITEPLADWPPGLTRYRPLHALGGGGMGVVYLCHDQQLDRQVAVKFPAGGRAGDDRRHVTLAEARSAARLHHPNICPVFDANASDGVPYLTMAFIDGPSLTAELKRCGPCPPAVAARLVRTVAEAMQYAHDQGVIHRDLKPANVMLTAEREPVVTDFGLAVRQDREGIADGVVAGTPYYMAPEQWAGDAASISERTDVFALGVILFEMLTGRVPFDGTARQVRELVQREPIPDVREFQPDVPAGLARVVATATAIHPADRFPTMTAFADALTDCLRVQKAPAKRTPRWVFPLVAGVAAAVALPMLLCGAAVLLPNLQRLWNTPPTVPPLESVESLLLQGEELEGVGQTGPALLKYSEAVQLAPESVPAREHRGRLAAKLELYPMALDDFTVLVGKDRTRADYHLSRGEALFWTHRVDEAMAEANTVVELRPEWSEGFRLRADVWNERQEYRKAIDQATKAIDLAPDDPVPLRVRALAKSLSGDEVGSLKDADHAAELEKKQGTFVPAPPLPVPPLPPPPGK